MLKTRTTDFAKKLRTIVLKTLNSLQFQHQAKASFRTKQNPPIFIVVTQSIVHLADKSASTLPNDLIPTFILNGINKEDTFWLRQRHPKAYYIRLQTSISGRNHNLVSHGEVIDLIARASTKDFCLMDADNFILDHSVLGEMNTLKEHELASGPFMKSHDKNGAIIPETFLISINSQLIKKLKATYGVSAEVTRNPDPKAKRILREAGFPDGTFPEPTNDFWDTLQVYWCIAQHQGYTFRLVDGNTTKSVHVGGTSYLSQLSNDVTRWDYLPLAVHYLNLCLMELPEMKRFEQRFDHLKRFYKSPENLVKEHPTFMKSKRFEDVNRVINTCFHKSNKISKVT
jgi:hypothetical protein